MTILDKLRVERVLHYLVFVLLEQKLDGCPVVFVGRLAQAKESKDVVEPQSLLSWREDSDPSAGREPAVTEEEGGEREMRDRETMTLFLHPYP